MARQLSYFFDNDRLNENNVIGAEDFDMDDDIPSHGYGMGDFDDDDDSMSIVVSSEEPIGHVSHSTEHSIDVAVYVEIKKLSECSSKILSMVKSKSCCLEPWMQAQLVKASSQVCEVYSLLEGEEEYGNDCDDL